MAVHRLKDSSEQHAGVARTPDENEKLKEEVAKFKAEAERVRTNDNGEQGATATDNYPGGCPGRSCRQCPGNLRCTMASSATLASDIVRDIASRVC